MSNVAGKGFYGDLEGNSLHFPLNQDNNRTEWYCPQPPDQDDDLQQEVSVTSQFTCNQGYRLEVTYTIKSYYNLLTANPNNSSQISKGRLLLKNSSGTVVWSNTNMAITSIVNLGTTPDDYGVADLTIFQVKYITPYISESTYNSSAKAWPSLFIYTDCPNIPTVSIPYSAQQAASTYDLITLPCLRVDKVWWNPSTGLGASLAGMDAVPGSCYPYNYVYPDKQEIQIYANGVWQAIQLWEWDPQGGTIPNNTGKIIHSDIWYISMSGYIGGTISAGNYQVRYRNRQEGTSNGGPCVSQPTNTWVTETWYISI